MEGEEIDSKEKEAFHADEKVLVSTVTPAYTGAYILVKILSMGAFYYEFIKCCLSKVDLKKEQTIILKQNLKSQRNNLTRGSSGQYNLTRKRVRSHDF